MSGPSSRLVEYFVVAGVSEEQFKGGGGKDGGERTTSPVCPTSPLSEQGKVLYQTLAEVAKPEEALVLIIQVRELEM